MAVGSWGWIVRCQKSAACRYVSLRASPRLLDRFLFSHRDAQHVAFCTCITHKHKSHRKQANEYLQYTARLSLLRP